MLTNNTPEFEEKLRRLFESCNVSNTGVTYELVKDRLDEKARELIDGSQLDSCTEINFIATIYDFDTDGRPLQGWTIKSPQLPEEMIWLQYLGAMAKQKPEENSPEKASEIFHKLLKASVTGVKKPKEEKKLNPDQQELANLLKQGKNTSEIKIIMGDRYYLALEK